MIPSGATFATFAVKAAAKPFVTVDTTATITASGIGQNVVMVSPLIGRLVITPTSIVSGKPTTGLILLRAKAKAGGESVALNSDSGSVIVPTVVVVPDGANRATFTIGTSAVASATTATITATLNGANTKASINLQPALHR
jgi:hypothetical protein